MQWDAGLQEPIFVQVEKSTLPLSTHQFQLGGWPPTTTGTIVLCVCQNMITVLRTLPSTGPNNKNRHRLVDVWRVEGTVNASIGIWTYQKTPTLRKVPRNGVWICFPAKGMKSWFMVRWPQKRYLPVGTGLVGMWSYYTYAMNQSMIDSLEIWPVGG